MNRLAFAFPCFLSIGRRAFFVAYRYWERKLDLLRKSETEEIVGGPRTISNIDTKTEYPREKHNAMHLVRYRRRGVS